MSLGSKSLPGTGRGTVHRTVEGAIDLTPRWRRTPSTTPLRVAVPLPMLGRL
jgi:hypothetical protein